MRNKKTILNVFCCLFLLSMLACNDDNDDPSDLQVYVQSAGASAGLYNGSTINFLATDTLIVTVEGGIIAEGSALGDYIVETSSNLNVSLSDTADNVYYITASEAGTGRIFIADDTFSYSSDLSGLTYIDATIVIHNPKIKWTVLISVNDTVETEDEALSADIADSLTRRDIYFPASYIFEYATTDFPGYGFLQAVFNGVNNQRDTVAGTFIEKLSSGGDTLVNLIYNDQSFLYTYRQSITSTTTITEDLTEEYQNKYPDRTITKVLDVSAVRYSSVTLQLVELNLE